MNGGDVMALTARLLPSREFVLDQESEASTTLEAHLLRLWNKGTEE
jgi:hypothetical protein